MIYHTFMMICDRVTVTLSWAVDGRRNDGCAWQVPLSGRRYGWYKWIGNDSSRIDSA